MLKKILLLISVAISSVTMAACGGGGWKHSDLDKRLTPAEQYLLTEEIKSELDTSVINKNVNNLGLNQKQAALLDRTMNEIRDTLSYKKRVLTDARANFRNCIGDCPALLKLVKAAMASLKSWNPNEEFNTRLSAILTRDQFGSYQRMKSETALAPKPKAGEFSSAK